MGQRQAQQSTGLSPLSHSFFPSDQRSRCHKHFVEQVADPLDSRPKNRFPRYIHQGPQCFASTHTLQCFSSTHSTHTLKFHPLMAVLLATLPILTIGSTPPYCAMSKHSISILSVDNFSSYPKPFFIAKHQWVWNYMAKLSSIFLLPFNSQASRFCVSAKFVILPTTLSRASAPPARTSNI